MKLLFVIINVIYLSVVSAEDKVIEYEYQNKKYKIIYDQFDTLIGVGHFSTPENEDDERFRVLSLGFLKGDLLIIDGQVLWNRVYYGNISELKEIRYKEGMLHHNMNKNGVKLDLKKFLYPSLQFEINGTTFRTTKPF